MSSRRLLHLAWLTLFLLASCQPEAKSEAARPSSSEDDVARTEVERGPVKLIVELRPKKPRLSDEPELTLRIEAEKGVDVEMPPFGEALGAFVIRDFHEPLPEIREGKRIIRQVYTLEPTQAGSVPILPINITFTDNRPGGDGEEHQLETEGLNIEVQSLVATEAPSLADLSPADGPVPLPEEPASWWPWAGGGLLLAGLLFFHALKKKRALPLEKKLSPRELAYHELQKLVDQGLSELDVKLFYVELTGIVRRYIERTTAVRAPEQTTEEFLHEISGKKIFPPDEQRRLGSFLESADLVKFAALKPQLSEIEGSFDRAKAFIGLQEEGAAA